MRAPSNSTPDPRFSRGERPDDAVYFVTDGGYVRDDRSSTSPPEEASGGRQGMSQIPASPANARGVEAKARRRRHPVPPWVGSTVRAWRYPLLRRALALADAAASGVALLTIAVVGGGLPSAVWAATTAPAWIVLAKFHGLYDRDQRTLRHTTADELRSILAWALSGTALASVVVLLSPVPSLDLHVPVVTWLVTAGTAVTLRSVVRHGWKRFTPPQPTVIIGTGALADATRRKFELFSDIHVDVVGERADVADPDLWDDLDWLDGVERVVLASEALDEATLVRLLALCRLRGIKLSVVPPARAMFGTAVQLNHIAELPVIEYNTLAPAQSTLLLKRILDVVISAPALVLLAPLFSLIAIAIRLDSRGGPVFSQLRAGEGGRPFRMYKFRTMVCDAEARLGDVVSLDELRDPMFKLCDDPRVTRVGRLLRRTSMDELPQLFNVLRADMSLVGPRPEQVELVARYQPEHRFRLSVRPGLTGPMQVYGRGQLTFEERLAVERDYIENLSLSRDLRILALTASAVLGGRGAF